MTKPLKIGGKRNRGVDEHGRFTVGNPGGPGRPKGSLSVVDAIRRELEKVIPGQKKTYLEKLVTKVLFTACTVGDVAMIKDIIDRVDGKPAQTIMMKDDRMTEEEALDQLKKELLNDNSSKKTSPRNIRRPKKGRKA
jgi:hypothetical protein